jgi:hypothetical protein
MLSTVIADNFPDPFPSSITALSHVPLQAGEMVIKHGRTTRWTLGEVNGCKAVHFSWLPKQQTSRAIAIVGHGGVPFCAKGDSGSMILNSKGEAAALLFAGKWFAQESVHGVTYAIDIQATIEDIERHTPLRNMKLLA